MGTIGLLFAALCWCAPSVSFSSAIMAEQSAAATLLEMENDVVDLSVGAGDTLTSISERYAVPVDEFKAANPKIVDWNVLQVGQLLQMPSAAQTTVQVVGTKASNPYQLQFDPELVGVNQAPPCPDNKDNTMPSPSRLLSKNPTTKVLSAENSNMECMNGGLMQSNSTICKCIPPWQGATCEVCRVQCLHGTMEKDCQCACDPGWIGPNCDVCARFCNNEGSLDPESCACNCELPFSGEDCSDCTRCCSNGAQLDSSKCSCNCKGGWQGPTCSECALKCKHGRPSEDCSSCECEDNWGARFCNSCIKTCQNGGNVTDACECECPQNTAGESCEVCKTVCLNGGVADELTCKCLCPVGTAFTGPQCECNQTCANGGKLNPNTCMCSCTGDWSGDACEVCDLRCMNGAEVNTRDCSCNCAMAVDQFSKLGVEQARKLSAATGQKGYRGGKDTEGVEQVADELKDSFWFEALTSEPQIGQLWETWDPERDVFENNTFGEVIAEHGLKIEDKIPRWGGKTCEDCKLACQNGGILDSKYCSCSCAKPWAGVDCSACDGICLNGGIRNQNCECSCPGNWTGARCESCDLTCLSGGKLDPYTCTCDCSGGWGGDSCHICNKKCDNGGILDPNLCKCTCPQAPPWYGETCSTCGRVCLHGGSLDAKFCACSCPADSGWVGAECNTCKKKCFRGGTLNPETCTCECPAEPPWQGSTCSECDRKCENGGILDKETCTCKCPALSGWGGLTCAKCTRQCANGGVLNAKTCDCECDPGQMWGGEQCTVCNRNCGAHGKLNKKNCQCKCTASFSKENCNQCSVSCAHGTINADICKCNCNAPWNGAECDELEGFECKNGGVVNPNLGSCECPYPWAGTDCRECKRNVKNGGELLEGNCSAICPYGFTGPHCETCIKSCSNGGRLVDCKCQCAWPWVGDSCKKCNITCENGSLDKDSCTCNCKPNWASPSCNACTKVCFNGGVLDYTTCQCKCQLPWSGETCSTCTKTCENGGILDIALCTCRCLRNTPWRGERCTKCKRKCKNGGQLDEATCSCQCPAPWKGPDCFKCPLKCLHGGILDTEKCSCYCPVESPWIGTVCEVCNLACASGGTLDSKSCTCKCPRPWSGSTCKVCDVKCQNGASLDEKSCKCQCSQPWTGFDCGDCSRKCDNGGTITPSSVSAVSGKVSGCECNCPYPWEGPLCKKCALVCENGGVLDSSTCTCSCPKDFTGKSCNACAMSQDQCKHGNTFNATTCSCMCNYVEGNAFSGRYCNTPACGKDSEGKICGGVGYCKLGECQCPQGFFGKYCTNSKEVSTFSCTGQTHIVTFDGLPYNWYKAGTSKIFGFDSPKLGTLKDNVDKLAMQEIQMLTYQSNVDEYPSARGVALKVGVHMVHVTMEKCKVVFPGKSRYWFAVTTPRYFCIPTVRVNCEEMPTPKLSSFGMTITRTLNLVAINTPAGAHIKLFNKNNRYFNVYVTMSAPTSGQANGLGGNFNTIAKDDLSKGLRMPTHIYHNTPYDADVVTNEMFVKEVDSLWTKCAALNGTKSVMSLPAVPNMIFKRIDSVKKGFPLTANIAAMEESSFDKFGCFGAAKEGAEGICNNLKDTSISEFNDCMTKECACPSTIRDLAEACCKSCCEGNVHYDFCMEDMCSTGNEEYCGSEYSVLQEMRYIQDDASVLRAGLEDIPQHQKVCKADATDADKGLEEGAEDPNLPWRLVSSKVHLLNLGSDELSYMQHDSLVETTGHDHMQQVSPYFGASEPQAAPSNSEGIGSTERIVE